MKALAITAVLASAMAGCRSAAQPQTSPTDEAASLPELAASDPVARVSESNPTPVPTRLSLPTGRACRIHLRRDALGLSGVAPLSIQHVSPASRAAAIEGTVERATDDWVVLRAAGGRTYWIRADVILAVEVLEAQ